MPRKAGPRSRIGRRRGDICACTALDEVSPVLAVIPLQIFAYYVAKERECNIDKPKNLAKSVTVE